MNVLLLLPSNENAGPVNVVKYLLNAKFDDEITFHVICLRKKSDYLFNNSSTVFLPESLSFFKKIKWIVQYATANNISIVHSHGFFPDLFNVLISKVKKKCIVGVSTVHNYPNIDYRYEYGHIKGTVLSRLHFYLLSKLKRIYSCSGSVSDNLRSFSLNSETIRNGVSVSSVGELSTLGFSDIDNHNNSEFNALKLCFVGRMIERKNFEELYQSLLILNDLKVSFKLIICGDGPLLFYYKKKLAMFDNVCFLGHVSDPSPYIANCDVLLSTSFSEGFPLSVLEAVSLRKRVVLSNISPHLELKDFLGDIVQCYRLGNPNHLVQILTSHYYHSEDDIDRAVYLSSSKRMLCQYISSYEQLLS